MLANLRLKWFKYRLIHGMHWKKAYPTLGDLGRRKKILVATLLVVLGMHSVVHSKYEVETTHANYAQAMVLKDSYLRGILACLNRQAFGIGDSWFLCETSLIHDEKASPIASTRTTKGSL